MNTDMTWQTSSTSSEQTERIAERLGRKLRGGEVIELVSDVGGGKTTFVRGLARGMGSTDHVASPTFTLSREYTAGVLTLYHFDFYRLDDPGIVADELAEFVDDPRAIVVVEWGEIVDDVLPERRLKLRLTTDGESSRQLAFLYPPELAYVFEDVPDL